MKKVLKDHFIPHKENDYSPHILQKAAVTGMMLMIVLSFAVANLQSLVWIASDWMVSTILPAVVVAETNQERVALALAPLQRNIVLDAAATKKAQHMAENEYFAHFSPDGVSPWYWFNEAKYTFIHAGENLAIHFTDSSEVVNAWMNSPSHRDNIVNGNYKEIGIGTAQGTYEGYPTVYVVQLFGAPAQPLVVASETLPVDTQPVEVIEIALAPTTNEGGAVLAATEDRLEEAEPPLTPEEIVSRQLFVDTQIVVEQSATTLVSDETASSTAATTSGAVFEDAVEVVKAVEVVEDRVVVFSGHIATTTFGVPAYVEPVSLDDEKSLTTEPSLAFLTQPHKVLQVLYVMIGLFVAIALSISIVLEIRRQNPLQIAYGAGLIVTMFALFYIHMSVSSGVLIV